MPYPPARARCVRVSATVKAIFCGAVVALVAAAVGAGTDRTQTSLSTDVPAPRIAGPDRVATNEALAAEWQQGGGAGESVVVVPRDQTAMALAATGLAGRLGSVTLLSDTPPRPSTVAVARGLGATTAVVVGSVGLSAAWQEAGFAVDRVIGDDDHPDDAPAVAAAVAGKLFDAGPADEPRHVYLAGTTGLPDALAAGPRVYEEGAALLLSDRESLDPYAKTLLQRPAVDRVTLLGGTVRLGPGIAAELSSLGITVDRIAGIDREHTALALAEGRVVEEVLLAAGDDPADAVAGSALAAQRGMAVLPPGPTTRGWLAARCGTAPPITVAGGTAAIAPDVAAGHRRAAQRCDGPREPLTVRVAVATPGAPGAAAEVAALATDEDGWRSREIRLTGVADAPDVGLIVGHPEACGGPAVCRRGINLVLDGGFWTSSTNEGRRRLVNHALGTWLAQPVKDDCRGAVMDPLWCPGASSTPTAAERQAVAERFVPRVALAFAGDVHGERQIAAAVATGDNPLRPVATALSAADLAVVNLETPLSTRGVPATKTYVFRGPPALADDLAEAGVDIVNLANNHTLDYGVTAMLDTLDHSRSAGLATVGAGTDATDAYAPAIVDADAGDVAVIGLTRVLHTRTWEDGRTITVPLEEWQATATRPGLASAYDEPAAVAAIQRATAVADHVVVVIHWGTERADCPDTDQRHLARLLTDAGADVIVGHHPHVLQGVQALDGRLVAYSLGNFVWYHNRAPSRFTGILEVELPLLDQPQWSFVPAEIGLDGSPYPVSGDQAGSITGRLLARSPSGLQGCGFP